VGGFLNNISGWYPSEDWEWAFTTSSSNANADESYEKYTTVGAGIGAGDTINSVTLNIHVTVWSDPFGVATWIVFTDNLNSWGILPPPFHTQGGYAGVTNYNFGFGAGPLGWNQIPLDITNFPHSGIFNMSILGAANSTGQIDMRWDSTTKGGATKPYVVVDYTPASTTKTYSGLMTMNIG
jgi:hypothetical protein